MSGTPEFTLPTTLEEAEPRRQQLTLDVQSIQAQLGDKQRTDENGRRLSSREYWAWKKRATHALNQRLDELRVVKQWIRDNRSTADRVDTAEHLQAVCSVVRHAEARGLTLPRQSRIVVADAEEHLQRIKKNVCSADASGDQAVQKS